MSIEINGAGVITGVDSLSTPAVTNTAGSASAPSITFTGDTNTGIYSPGADQVAISTGGSGRLFVNSAGVITTDSAITGSRFNIVNSNSVSTYDRLLAIRNGSLTTAFLGVGLDSFYVASASGSPMVFCTNSDGGVTGSSVPTNERLRITAAGLVGVGTSSPEETLDANGAIVWRGGLNSGKTSAGALDRSGNELRIRAYGATAGTGQLVFRTGGGGGSVDTEAMRIDASQRVGIGTSAPPSLCSIAGPAVTGTVGRLLQVYASSAVGVGSGSEIWLGWNPSNLNAGGGATIGGIYNGTGADLVFSTPTNSSSAPTERVRIDSSGRLGIGTNSPSAKLHVVDTVDNAGPLFENTGARASITVKSSATTYSSYVNFGNPSGNSRAFIDFRESSGYLGLATSFAGGYLTFSTDNQQERLRIDSSGRLLVGTSSTSADTRAIIQGRSSAGDSTGRLHISSGNNTPGDGDGIAELYFTSSGHVASGRIAAQRDGGTWTAGSSLPTRLVFSTTADGASSPTERMRIQQNGFVKVANNGNHVSTTDAVHRFESDNASNPYLTLRAQNANYAGEGLQLRVNRAANSVYWFLAGQSSDGGDNEFVLKGDGNAFADGSWSGGGADYAEYFEWSDSNPSAEDRRGISVVLDGDKIRKAQPGEDPIGVISGNPSVVGDAAWNKWSGKYLRDEYGTYTLDENGDRQLNPAYDPDVEYISREQRPEWDCVGLMGKLRIRKGQVTGSRWIKMRDISNSVEEWMVR